MIRIHIVEDHVVMRESIQHILDDEADMEVCGASATGEEALDHVIATRPDLVLIDVSLPGIDGVEVLTQLRTQRPDLVAVMLTGHTDAEHVNAAMHAGARAYLVKRDAYDLPDLVRRAARGESFVTDGGEA
ncbi:MAG: response regulator transcription factor [Myxococcota bacterium]